MYIIPPRICKHQQNQRWLVTIFSKELSKPKVLKTLGCQELSQAKLLPLEPKSGTLQELLQQVLQALEDRNGWDVIITLQETNISSTKALWKMIFPFPRWDRLVYWRVFLFFNQWWFNCMYTYWEPHTMQRCLTRMLFLLFLSLSLSFCFVMFDCGCGNFLDGTYTVKLDWFE